jgi:hypothetical protein
MRTTSRGTFCTQRYGPDKVEDIGIVLQDLCVVDIDCMGIDREMNVRFPNSKTMCERTKKGHHYFFKRSKLADDGGYYDGRSAHPQS